MSVAPAPVAANDTAAAPRDTIGDTPFPVMMRLARANSLAIAVVASVIALILLAVLLFRRRGGSSSDDEE
jgi:mannose/fructose-specific phosphotransferase system component IIA